MASAVVRSDHHHETDLHKALKGEYVQLQRDYRRMESGLQGQGRLEAILVSNQKRIIQFVKKEGAEFQIDLKNAGCTQVAQNDENSKRLIIALMLLYEEYHKKINWHLNAIVDIEHHVDDITSQVIKQKLKILSMFGEAMNTMQYGKRSEILENRLYNLTTQFDTNIWRNRGLVVDINNLLSDRGRYHKRYTVLKKNISTIKRRMFAVVEKSTNAYNHRDEYVLKSRGLKEREDKEIRQHRQEGKDLQRVLHNDDKIKGFMRTKSKSRVTMESEEERAIRIEITREKGLDRTLRAYKRSFDVIFKIEESKDVDILCRNYLDREQVNLSKFKALAEQNDEIETLENEVKDLQWQIVNARQQHEETVMKLQEKLYEQQDRVVISQHLLKEAHFDVEMEENLLEDVVKDVETVFTTAKCGTDTFTRLLGNKDKIFEARNMPMCITAVENKIESLIQERSTLELRKKVEVKGVSLTNIPVAGAGKIPVRRPKPMGGPFRPKVVIPGFLNLEDDDEEHRAEIHPLTYDDVREQMRIKARQTATQQNKQSFNPQSSTSILTITDASTAGSSIDKKKKRKHKDSGGSTTADNSAATSLSQKSNEDETDHETSFDDETDEEALETDAEDESEFEHEG